MRNVFTQVVVLDFITVRAPPSPPHTRTPRQDHAHGYATLNPAYVAVFETPSRQQTNDDVALIRCTVREPLQE